MSLESNLRHAFEEQEGRLPDRPGDLVATKRRGRRRRHVQVVLAAMAVLAVVVVPVWLVSPTGIDDLVIDPADEAERSDGTRTVTMLLPNGDRVEVVAPPELPTEQVRATAEVTTGDQPVLMVVIDPAWGDPSWPEGESAPELEITSVGERWGGDLFEMTGSEAQPALMLWRGQDHGVLLDAVIGTAADLVDALTLEERTDGVLVQVDPELVTDPGWGVLGVTIGAQVDDAGTPVTTERLAVNVMERTDAATTSARTDRGGEELEARSVAGGELYEDGDGRLHLVGDTAIVRSAFSWDLGPEDQRERMLEIMTDIDASWEAGSD
jgi:hypothetical protein